MMVPVMPNLRTAAGFCSRLFFNYAGTRIKQETQLRPQNESLIC